jgi:hypothetical protein
MFGLNCKVVACNNSNSNNRKDVLNLVVELMDEQLMNNQLVSRSWL